MNRKRVAALAGIACLCLFCSSTFEENQSSENDNYQQDSEQDALPPEANPEVKYTDYSEWINLNKTVLPQSILDSGINNISCPDTCLDYVNQFNCSGEMLICVGEWSQGLEQFCYEDKKYCSQYNWSLYCLENKYQCNDACAASCNECLLRINCQEPSYTCHDSCWYPTEN